MHVLKFVFRHWSKAQKMTFFFPISQIWMYPPKTHFIIELMNYIGIFLVELSKIHCVLHVSLSLTHTVSEMEGRHTEYKIFYLHIWYERKTTEYKTLTLLEKNQTLFNCILLLDNISFLKNCTLIFQSVSYLPNKLKVH